LTRLTKESLGVVLAQTPAGIRCHASLELLGMAAFGELAIEPYN
jgi:hypothetical protein